jgi:hypothetical protein
MSGHALHAHISTGQEASSVLCAVHQRELLLDKWSMFVEDIYLDRRDTVQRIKMSSHGYWLHQLKLCTCACISHSNLHNHEWSHHSYKCVCCGYVCVCVRDIVSGVRWWCVYCVYGAVADNMYTPRFKATCIRGAPLICIDLHTEIHVSHIHVVSNQQLHWGIALVCNSLP